MAPPSVHSFHRPQRPGGGDCPGSVSGIYMRRGTGNGRFVRIGRMCDTCSTLWPLDESPLVSIHSALLRREAA